MATQPHQLHTLEEYLELERKAEYKSEFHSGEIYAMAGGTLTHSRLSARMCSVLDRHFPHCQIFDSNLKLYVSKANRCVYPDAMVLCGTPEYQDNHRDVIVNPSLVAEVLSPSTADYDREPKADYYRSVRSVSNILLISQDEVFVEYFARQANQTWIITPYSDGASVIEMLGAQLRVEEIYRGIL